MPTVRDLMNEYNRRFPTENLSMPAQIVLAPFRKKLAALSAGLAEKADHVEDIDAAVMISQEQYDILMQEMHILQLQIDVDHPSDP